VCCSTKEAPLLYVKVAREWLVAASLDTKRGGTRCADSQLIDAGSTTVQTRRSSKCGKDVIPRKNGSPECSEASRPGPLNGFQIRERQIRDRPFTPCPCAFRPLPSLIWDVWQQKQMQVTGNPATWRRWGSVVAWMRMQGDKIAILCLTNNNQREVEQSSYSRYLTIHA
jgi:hypothetical protein